ncbi:helicase-exonuclease AddAB subunit AddA [Parablautia intestinalis]|uniref:ATP-dependent helicase/nuclease subunit A n=1 Tax=Parablautia intestinalis TaxID=2320100 RepID=A0A3A9APE5_9FIRM|nr:helicase-exonuclease AddAB subunit AddA [Parablautia intestinalis]RKI93228.1 helicase-exonuclease AddAB subunit AddA [Parablautia intestinalis]
MAIAFTPEQRRVIELRDRNILVSAAAGSGKTAVLVERILSMITDDTRPVDIDRLLVVTFTNAAAAQMRERIGLAINRRLEEDAGNIHLQRQASLLHNAQITTIDSFCLFVIRNNFNDIGLDPGFRVVDEGELRLLGQDVMRDLLEEKYGEKEQSFLDCVEYFTGGSNDSLLAEYIKKLYDFSMSCPWPEDWISQCREEYKIADVAELENTDWCNYLLQHIRTMTQECKAGLDMAIEIAERPAGPYMYGKILEEEREMLERLLGLQSLTAYYEAFERVSFGRLPSKKDDSVSRIYREKVQQIRKDVKKKLEDLRESYLLLSPKEVVERMRKAAPNVECLLSLVLAYKQRLDEKKRQENMIDFYDMEHFALNILLKKDADGGVSPSPAALEYRQFFSEIMIDEYQDSNLVQELLLKSISGEEDGNFNRFMVGDVKQSIYKFRLARPELFMEKYSCYSKEDGSCQRIDLHKNFRSRRQVLDSVNRLFGKIMGEGLGGVEYDDEAALYEGAVYPEPAMPKTISSTEIVPESASEEAGLTASAEKAASASPYKTEYLVIGKDADSPLSAREQEAAAIAEKIWHLRQSLKVTDSDTGLLRPLRYGDIVILLRTASGWAGDFKKILEKEGIPAYVASQTGYFQAAEIRTLLQLLHVIDNPLQDIPLYGTLVSFFGGFTKEEIAGVRAMDKKIPLYDLLSICEGPLKERVRGFLDWLSYYRQKTAYTPIHKLIQEILSDTGYLDYVTARPGGQQRRANVEMLLTRAAAFENTSYYGLFHFLRYVEQLEKYEVDYGEADVLDENADVVRIMSIHKSKGLEFPVCFVAGLSKRFNMQDLSGRLIADIDMGIGVDYVDSVLRLKSHTLKKNVVALKMKLDALGEEMRVLYVAMTRAKEKLILTAMTEDTEKFREKLKQEKELGEQIKDREGKVPFSVLLGAGCYLDFIFPCMEDVQLVDAGKQLIEDIEGAVSQIRLRQNLEMTGTDNKLMAQLSEQFNRTYPYQYLSGLFVKTTVSELKKKGMHDLSERSMEDLEGEKRQGQRIEQAFGRKLYEEPEIVPYIPSFIRAKEKMSGADRGSAYHKVMELLDFKAIIRTEKTPEGIKAQLNRQMDDFVSQGLLEQTWREGISMAKLYTFFESSLAGRIMQAADAGKLCREQPFVLGLAAGRLGEEFPEGEQVLIQGIIDVFFEEDGKIVVADYKTDAVSDPKELIARYQTQLDYYEEALARLTDKKVMQKIIYSFALGQEIVLY